MSLFQANPAPSSVKDLSNKSFLRLVHVGQVAARLAGIGARCATRPLFWKRVAPFHAGKTVVHPCTTKASLLVRRFLHGLWAGARRAVLPCLLVPTLSLLSVPAAARGTEAGTIIPNTADMHFTVDGANRSIRSNTTTTRVDEILDVVVVAEQAEPVTTDSPMTEAILSFLVTNIGNGNEDYAIRLQSNINEGGFDPVATTLYVEQNGVPGLQVGAGGDLPYIEGSTLSFAANAQHSIYVVAEIPAGVTSNALSQVRLRAVSATLFAQTGLHDPDLPDFPLPGTDFPLAGDHGSTAVVGLSHNPAEPVFFDVSGFKIDAPIVTLDKSAIAVRALDGSDAVRPGSIVDYQLQVVVLGNGAIERATLTDSLPPELAFIAGSLRINGSIEDDDFDPIGLDAGGFDRNQGLLQVPLGMLGSTTGSHVITFSATIR